MKKTLGIIMAGGEGRRLKSLTSDIRAKPAVPFGGKYRIIDFVLSNFFNSGIKQICVLTQHKSFSLVEHVENVWARRLGSRSEFIRCLGPNPPSWYKGTADCVYQNIMQIHMTNPDNVAVFGGDHIYKMNVEQMIDFHERKGADLTVCAIRFPIEKAGSFGVIQVDENFRMISFEEKPANPKPIPGDPAHALVSMGNYIFGKDVLIEALYHDAFLSESETSHDFGKNIIPRLCEKGNVFVYDFMGNTWSKENIKASEIGYWRDVGTVDSYFESNMDLIGVEPVFNLYDKSWPIYGIMTDNMPPAKFVFAGGERSGQAVNSIVSDGCIISGGWVENSVMSPEVRVNSYSHITNSILFDNVDIGRHCILDKVIVDKNVRIPAGTVLTPSRIWLPELPPIDYDIVDPIAYTEDHKKKLKIFRKLLETGHKTENGVSVVPRYYEHDYC